MSTPTQAPAKGQAAAAPVAGRPFITGTRTIERAIYDQTKTQTAGTQKLPTYNLDTDGFTSGMYILVEATTSANAATVAFNADAPLNALGTVQFSDTNNKAITGPFTGHDLYEAVKFGGYAFSDDAKLSPIYSATTGAGGTGGSFTFILRLPIEIVHRDGLGSLLNKSASAVFKCDITLAASTDVYSTPPTTLPSIRVRIQQFGWMDSDLKDSKGNPASPNPPALNTLQFWDKQTIQVGAGSLNQVLNTFSGLVRNFIFELRDNTGSRTQGDADFPDPFELHVDKTVPVSRLKTVWRHQIGEDFGYQGTTPDVGGARDYGVYPLPYNRDFGLKPGAENRFGYLPVSSATSVMMKGSIGGAGTHTMNVFVNYVAPANGDPKSITGGR
jgi:hypothetical protein